jgi:hypothetical protein
MVAPLETTALAVDFPPGTLEKIAVLGISGSQVGMDLDQGTLEVTEFAFGLGTVIHTLEQLDKITKEDFSKIVTG